MAISRLLEPMQSDGSERRAASVRGVNCTIPLYDDHLEIYSGYREKWVEANAIVNLRLTPTPRVLIEITGVPSTFSGNLYNPGKSSKIRRPGGPDMDVHTLQVRLGESDSSLLMPVSQPVTSIETGAALQSVSFYILNFPSLCQHDRHAVLQQGPWHIEIWPREDIHAVRQALNAESGYGLTHEGSMIRSDAEPFRVKEAATVLNALHHFLSFARGGSCGIALIAGTDAGGNTAWEQWGAYSTFPWFTRSSWLDHRHNNDAELAEAFPGFLQRVMEGRYGVEDRVHMALYWYLRSNELDSPYSGIVLTQAALERLSRDALSDVESRSVTKSSLLLRRALEKAGICARLPASCYALHQAYENETDGPKVLVNARNDLAHAEVGRVLSLDALVEARNLGQGYAEMLLLRQFGYQGRYANRLSYADGKSSPETVPWAR